MIRARRGRRRQRRRGRRVPRPRRCSRWTSAASLTAGLFNFSLAVIAGLFGVTQTIGDVARLRSVRAQLLARACSPPARRSRDLSSPTRSSPSLAGTHRAGRWSASAPGWSGRCCANIGFRLDRTETGLRRRRGLLTLTDVTMPVKRASRPRSSPPARSATRFGWRELKLQSLAKDEAARATMSSPRWRRDDEVARDPRRARLARRRPGDRVASACRRAYVWALRRRRVAAAHRPPRSQFALRPARSASLASLVIAALIAMPLARWRRYRYALDGDRLLVRTGWWRRRLRDPAARQDPEHRPHRELRRPPVRHRHLRSASPAAAAFPAHHIPALPRETARALRDAAAIPLRMSFACNVEQSLSGQPWRWRRAGRRRARPRPGRPAAAGARGRAQPTSPATARRRIRDFLPDPSVFADMDKAARASPTRSSAARRSPSSATMTSTARPRAALLICCCAGSAPSRSSTSPTG